MTCGTKSERRHCVGRSQGVRWARLLSRYPSEQTRRELSAWRQHVDPRWLGVGVGAEAGGEAAAHATCAHAAAADATEAETETEAEAEAEAEAEVEADAAFASAERALREIPRRHMRTLKTSCGGQ